MHMIASTARHIDSSYCNAMIVITYSTQCGHRRPQHDVQRLEAKSDLSRIVRFSPRRIQQRVPREQAWQPVNRIHKPTLEHT